MSSISYLLNNNEAFKDFAVSETKVNVFEKEKKDNFSNDNLVDPSQIANPIEQDESNSFKKRKSASSDSQFQSNEINNSVSDEDSLCSTQCGRQVFHKLVGRSHTYRYDPRGNNTKDPTKRVCNICYRKFLDLKKPQNIQPSTSSSVGSTSKSLKGAKSSLIELPQLTDHQIETKESEKIEVGSELQESPVQIEQPLCSVAGCIREIFCKKIGQSFSYRYDPRGNNRGDPEKRVCRKCYTKFKDFKKQPNNQSSASSNVGSTSKSFKATKSSSTELSRLTDPQIETKESLVQGEQPLCSVVGCIRRIFCKNMGQSFSYRYDPRGNNRGDPEKRVCRICYTKFKDFKKQPNNQSSTSSSKGSTSKSFKTEESIVTQEGKLNSRKQFKKRKSEEDHSGSSILSVSKKSLTSSMQEAKTTKTWKGNESTDEENDFLSLRVFSKAPKRKREDLDLDWFPGDSLDIKTKNTVSKTKGSLEDFSFIPKNILSNCEKIEKIAFAMVDEDNEYLEKFNVRQTSNLYKYYYENVFDPELKQKKVVVGSVDINNLIAKMEVFFSEFVNISDDDDVIIDQINFKKIYPFLVQNNFFKIALAVYIERICAEKGISIICKDKHEIDMKGLFDKYLQLEKPDNTLRPSNEFNPKINYDAFSVSEVFSIPTFHRSLSKTTKAITEELRCENGYEYQKSTLENNKFQLVRLIKNYLARSIRAEPSRSLSRLRHSVQKDMGVSGIFIPEFCPLFVSYLKTQNLIKEKGIRFLDPCAGWGDRFLGSLASKDIVHYTGIDPNSKMHPIYKTIEKTLLAYANTKLKKTMTCDFIQSPAEDVDMEKLEKYDLVFTSPPYFNCEKYCDEPTQSSIKYPELDLWKKNFLYPMLKNSVKALNVGGILAINIADYIREGKRTEICEDMAAEVGSWKGLKTLPILGLAFQNSIHRSTAASYEPIFMWQKTEE